MHSLYIRKQLDTLHLNIQSTFCNEIIVISGENGAGKSTLLRCIAGLESCEGELHIHADTWLDSAMKVIKPTEHRSIGFVWSDAVLLPWLDVQANIKLGITLDDVDWFGTVCRTLEVHSLLKRKPMTLSTGEAQRVSLARAWYAKPLLLLLDEPFSAQAPDIRARLRVALQMLQQILQLPILMVSHDIEDAMILGHQHWRMREGKRIKNNHTEICGKGEKND